MLGWRSTDCIFQFLEIYMNRFSGIKGTSAVDTTLWSHNARSLLISSLGWACCFFRWGSPRTEGTFWLIRSMQGLGQMLVRNMDRSSFFHGSKQHILENWRILLIIVFSDSYDIVKNFFKYYFPFWFRLVPLRPLALLIICLRHIWVI